MSERNHTLLTVSMRPKMPSGLLKPAALAGTLKVFSAVRMTAISMVCGRVKMVPT